MYVVIVKLISARVLFRSSARESNCRNSIYWTKTGDAEKRPVDAMYTYVERLPILGKNRKKWWFLGGAGGSCWRLMLLNLPKVAKAS